MVLPLAEGVVNPPDDDSDETPTVRTGSRGSEVQALQKFLKIPADGIFGPMTEAAVKTFQMAQGLGIDGIVGPNTWGRIDDPKSVYTQETSQYLPYTLWLRSPYSYRSQYQALTRLLNSELLLPAAPVFSEISDAANPGFSTRGRVGRRRHGRPPDLGHAVLRGARRLIRTHRVRASCEDGGDGPSPTSSTPRRTCRDGLRRPVVLHRAELGRRRSRRIRAG